MPEITISTSKICGLVYFVDTIAGRPHTTEALKHWYLNQRTNDIQLDKKICSDYSNCLDEVANKYEAHESTDRQLSLSQRIVCMASRCETMHDLLNELQAIVPSDGWCVISAAYKHFEPIYELCIWESGYRRLREQLEDFCAGVAKVELLTKLELVRKFMGVTWPADIPFETIVIPLPEAVCASHADSVGNIQIVEIVANQTFDDQSDTLFHELCHSLWARRDKEKLKYQFESFGSSGAYYELNEALATSLSQGWFRRSAYPDESPKEVWYEAEIVETYARGLYPLVSNYLEQEACIDTEFVRHASQIFEEKCPQIGRDVIHTYAVHITSEQPPNYEKLQTAIFAAMPNIRKTNWGNLVDFNANDMIAHFRQFVLLSPGAINPWIGLTETQLDVLRTCTANCVSVKHRGSEIIFCIGENVRAQEEVFLEMLKSGYPS